MGNTCYYEVLGISSTATTDEIRKAYKTKALLLHPDKNHNRLEEATKEFAYLQQSYTVLSDPHERRWYDNHREAILRGSDKNTANRDDDAEEMFDLMPFFNASAYKGFNDLANGFFTVYRKVFEDIEAEENRLFVNLQHKGEKKLPRTGAVFTTFGTAQTSFIPTLKDFYTKWTHFSTLKSFSYMDKYYAYDETENRMHRRHLEKENKKLRNDKRHEYNDIVKSLALFIKKRDPRVAAYNEQLKELEQAKQDQLKERKMKNKSQGTHPHTSHFQEQDWTKINENEYMRYFGLHKDENESTAEFIVDNAHVNESEYPAGSENPQQSSKMTDKAAPNSSMEEIVWSCSLCNKLFKSEKQFSNHEVSNKHLKVLQALKLEMIREERRFRKANGLQGSAAQQMKDRNSDKDVIEQELFFSSAESNAGQNGAEETYYSMDDSHCTTDDQEDMNIFSDRPKSNTRPHGSDTASLEAALEATHFDNSSQAEEEPDSEATPNLSVAKAKKKKRRALKTCVDTPLPAISSYACQICKKEYDSRNALFKHIKSSKHVALK